MVKLARTIPALPVRDSPAAVDFYCPRLGFGVGHHDAWFAVPGADGVVHHDGGFAVLGRDDAVVHLWQAGDESWRERDSLERPVRSGAESFIAGTASCRIEVEGVDELFDELRGTDVLHPVSAGGVAD